MFQENNHNYEHFLLLGDLNYDMLV
jgi:hypothetical protein